MDFRASLAATYTKKCASVEDLSRAVTVMNIADCDQVIRYVLYTSDSIVLPMFETNLRDVILRCDEIPYQIFVDVVAGVNHLHGLGFCHGRINGYHILIRGGRAVISGLSKCQFGTKRAYQQDMWCVGLVFVMCIAGMRDTDQHTCADQDFGSGVLNKIATKCLVSDPDMRITSQKAAELLGLRPLPACYTPPGQAKNAAELFSDLSFKS